MIHRWRQSGLAGLLWLVLPALVSHGAMALNWEGHEGFFQEAQPLDEVTQGVPRPIVKPLPDCAEVRSKYQSNRYEQVALPGMNCTEKKP